MKNIEKQVRDWVDTLDSVPASIIEDSMMYNTDNWEIIYPSENYSARYFEDYEIEEDFTCLPIYGYLWSFPFAIDDEWLDNEENRDFMFNLGFKLYKYQNSKYYFGLDCWGMSFYEHYWTPLYKKRFNIE